MAEVTTQESLQEPGTVIAGTGGVKEPGGDLPGKTEGTETTPNSEEIQQIVAEAIATVEKQLKSEFEIKLDEARSEGERLANLSEKDKEAEKERIDKEKYEKERTEFEHEKLIFETGKILAEKNLSPEFAEFLALKDAETTKANIEKFEKCWNTEHQKRVDDLIKGTPPKTPGGMTDGKSDSSVDLAKQLGQSAGRSGENARKILDGYLNN